jgi:antitoxin component of RelBE/YafQ-DinJ toxin-antitoxin module
MGAALSDLNSVLYNPVHQPVHVINSPAPRPLLVMPERFRLFLTQMVRENGLPFRPTADPFYSAKNQAELAKSIAQLNAGQTVTKTLAELEAMAE